MKRPCNEKAHDSYTQKMPRLSLVPRKPNNNSTNFQVILESLQCAQLCTHHSQQKLVIWDLACLPVPYFYPTYISIIAETISLHLLNCKFISISWA